MITDNYRIIISNDKFIKNSVKSIYSNITKMNDNKTLYGCIFIFEFNSNKESAQFDSDIMQLLTNKDNYNYIVSDKYIDSDYDGLLLFIYNENEVRLNILCKYCYLLFNCEDFSDILVSSFNYDPGTCIAENLPIINDFLRNKIISILKDNVKELQDEKQDQLLYYLQLNLKINIDDLKDCGFKDELYQKHYVLKHL